MKKQAGMTLIELVIVIIVLGIIAAVAAPKFADISGDATTAAVDGSKGGFASAYTIAVAKSQGKPDFDTLVSLVDGMTCAVPNCDTPDWDKDAGTNPDLRVIAYTDDCTTKTAATLGTDIIAAYGYSFNGAAVAAGDCSEF